MQRRPFVFLIGLSAIAAVAIGAAGAALGQAPGSRPVVYPPEPAAAAAHVARARQIAGTDPALRIMSDGYACMSPEGIARFRAALDRGGEDQPVQLFDNLYMFGTRSVNSLVLRTSGGLIMWDALNNEQDARTIIEPGMRKFGLDPADIRLLIVTHAHGDHFGGAKYFQDRYKVPVASSDIDWAAMERARGSVPPPVRNRVLSDGEKVTVGDATVRMVLTPGHTPGALSSLLPVKDNGVTRVMALWGATTLPGNSAALRQYGDSLQHFSEAAKEGSAAGYLNTHAVVWKIAEQRAAAIDGGPNPLAIGEDRLQKLLEIKRECVEAAKAWWTAMGR